MNSAVLIAALVAPLVGALAALLVPTGEARRPRRTGKSSRRARKKAATDATVEGGAGEATVTTAAIETGGPDPTPAADPGAVERAGRTCRVVVRVAALSTAALWVAVTLLGPSAAGSALAVGAIAPGAAGAALLLATVARPARRLPSAGASLALALATGGLAFGAGDENTGLAVAGLAGAALLAVAGRSGDDGNLAPAALALVGTASLAGGLIRVAADTGALSLPAVASLPLDAAVLLVGGSAAVAIAAALRPRSTAGLLLPVALTLGVPAAAVIGSAGDGVALILMLLAAASAAAWALSPRSPRGDLRPLVATLALTSLAAAAVPTSGVPGSGAAVTGMQAAGVPAAWLLAAAAVITAVTLVPLAAVCALPGAAAMVVVLVADPEPVRLVLVSLIVAAAVAGAVAVRRPPSPVGIDPVTRARDDSEASPLLGPLVAAVPALAVGVWLVVAPGSWSWVGDVDLEGWTDTVGVALAGGLIAAVAGGATGKVAVPLRLRLAAPDPVRATTDTVTGTRLALAAGVGLGLALIALLASSSGAS